jgi:hypothetical protein
VLNQGHEGFEQLSRQVSGVRVLKALDVKAFLSSLVFILFEFAVEIETLFVDEAQKYDLDEGS